MKKTLSILGAIAVLIATASVYAQPAAEDCLDNIRLAAEHLATLNDLNPHQGSTSIEKVVENEVTKYEVTTVNKDGTRIGLFTVRLASFGFCRIASIMDDDAQD